MLLFNEYIYGILFNTNSFNIESDVSLEILFLVLLVVDGHSKAAIGAVLLGVFEPLSSLLLETGGFSNGRGRGDYFESG